MLLEWLLEKTKSRMKINSEVKYNELFLVLHLANDNYETMRSIIDYNRETMTITNLDQLPKGLNRSLLLVTASPFANEYIAKRWLRKMPASTARNESVMRV